jgi:hypothetical protein
MIFLIVSGVALLISIMALVVAILFNMRTRRTLRQARRTLRELQSHQVTVPAGTAVKSDKIDITFCTDKDAFL